MKTVLALVLILSVGFVIYSQMVLRQAENEAEIREKVDRAFSEAMNAAREKSERLDRRIEKFGFTEARRMEEKDEKEKREHRMLELQEEEVRLLQER